ncbi:MAG: Cgl0159 family (beta/alpha)8-fold protein [Ancrocorticia sp.]|uniref:Cgl0159 family (beta/alpha)8-fold protein n=1 Tax=Ancrocorticia sp. TaxID=2593684 RepID=UPI003F8EE1A5
MSLIEKISNIRATDPGQIAQRLAARAQPALTELDRLMVIACDHPARGALGAGPNRMAMASREDVLQRCVAALSRPGVNGFLGTADMIEDLTLLGALDGKAVWGSMNRAGLQGASFEMDDRFTCYDAAGIQEQGLIGGKMLLRFNFSDAATAATMEACAHAINDLSARGLNAMVEPFVSAWKGDRIVNDLSVDSVIRSIAIASGLGRTSAHTWLKLPCIPDMERVMEATTMPSLILGGEVSDDPEATYAHWAQALAQPNVRGLVIGRSLLYPPNDDVEAAVDQAVELL